MKILEITAFYYNPKMSISRFKELKTEEKHKENLSVGEILEIENILKKLNYKIIIK